MAIVLDIKSELPTAIKWTNEHTKQLPFSISQAMNASIKGLAAIPGSKQKSALNALAGSSKRFLDRPKPGTQTGFMATTAKKRNLSSLISPKTSHGIAIAIYLAASSAVNVRQNHLRLPLPLIVTARSVLVRALFLQVQSNLIVMAT